MEIFKTDYLVFMKYKLDHKKTYNINVANKSNEVLGEIKWKAGWRRYVYYPIMGTLYDTKCLTDIINYINILMEERKIKVVKEIKINHVALTENGIQVGWTGEFE